MKTRVLALLLVLVVALGVLPSVLAQDFTCFNLSADDCKLLQEAGTNSANITSANYAININFDADLGQLGAMMNNPTGKVTFQATGKGGLTEVKGANPPVALNLDASATWDVGQGPQKGDLGVVVKDGIVYWNLAGAGWQGAKLADLTSEFSSMMPGGSAMTPGTSGMDPSAFLKQLSDAGISMTDVMGLLTTPGLFDYQRMPDENLTDGSTASPFQLTVDLIPVLKSPSFKKILDAAAKNNPQAAQMAALIPALAEKSTFTIKFTQWIGKDDTMIHKVALDINLTTDASVMMGTAGGQAMPITANFHFDVELSGLNAPVDIAAPEGAQMMPSPSS